jgi:hypothetical protein
VRPRPPALGTPIPPPMRGRGQRFTERKRKKRPQQLHTIPHTHMILYTLLDFFTHTRDVIFLFLISFVIAPLINQTVLASLFYTQLSVSNNFRYIQNHIIGLYRHTLFETLCETRSRLPAPVCPKRFCLLLICLPYFFM